MSRGVKIALIQFEVRLNEDFEKTKKRVSWFINKASEKKCKIICFPEDFWFGPLDYYSEKLINKITGADIKKIISFICSQAKQNNINIIAGSLIQKVRRGFYNTSLVVNNAGEIVLKHNKSKLVPYGFEKERIISGNIKPKVVMLSGIKIGVLICRELFYPELFKLLREQGVEIVFIPSFWSKRSSDYLKNQLKNTYCFLSEMRVVDSLVNARSFENEVAICYVNACGNIRKNDEFDVLLGRTQVSLPFYGSYKKIKQNREKILFFKYDKSILDDARSAYRLYPQLQLSSQQKQH